MDIEPNVNTTSAPIQGSDSTPLHKPMSSGVVTSPVVYEITNGRCDHPYPDLTLEALINRAQRIIDDDVIAAMADVAPRSTPQEQRAADGLSVLLRARPKCLKLESRRTKSEGALAARYREWECPDSSLPYYSPSKSPCYTRAHPKCERHWARKEVQKRSRKFDRFIAERGGATLLTMEWPGIDFKQKVGGWRAFRRSKQRPEILKRAIFFREETPLGQRVWVLLPKLLESELESIVSLWDEVVNRYTGLAGRVSLVESHIPQDFDISPLIEQFAAYESTGLFSEDSRQDRVESDAFTVTDVAVALYMLARKSVFPLVSTGELTPFQGAQRFVNSLGKDAALFGEEMQEIDEELSQEQNVIDGSAQKPEKDGKTAPCVLHNGQHPAKSERTVDFTTIEIFMNHGNGYELEDGTLILTRPVNSVSFAPEDAIPPYHPLPPPERI